MGELITYSKGCSPRPINKFLCNFERGDARKGDDIRKNNPF